VNRLQNPPAPTSQIDLTFPTSALSMEKRLKKTFIINTNSSHVLRGDGTFFPFSVHSPIVFSSLPPPIMPLQSDLTIAGDKLDPKNISQQTHDFNANLIKIMERGPKWYEVSIINLL